uniref:NAD(P)H-quinone oxidoreductase subunit 6, chloroplastic n=1 Tax=Marsilea crenata TaxID=388472 RepID=S4UBD9_MARCR|nr:NADH-plastoquinone oxidoreductase subunit 6 [Marsilea crenata]AGI51483.1 NADH-plastoquinone oxidoreductase subunit 6 [Marsilea crenata]
MNLSESIHQGILVLIESGIVLGSLGVVSLANVVHSAFLLGSVFTRISLLYLVLNADFVAAAQPLVYVGAINVLIVFAVMVTDEPTGSNSPTKWNTGYFGALAACTVLFLLIAIATNDKKWSDISFLDQSTFVEGISNNNNVQQIGYRLLTTFLIPFELLSILLLIALAGAITMARNEDMTATDSGSVSASRDSSSTL